MNSIQAKPFDPGCPGNLPLDPKQSLNLNRDLDAAAADFEAAMKSDGGTVQSLAQESMKSIADKAVEGIQKASDSAEALTIMDSAMKELSSSTAQAIVSNPDTASVLVPAQAEAQIAMMNAYFAKFPVA